MLTRLASALFCVLVAVGASLAQSYPSNLPPDLPTGVFNVRSSIVINAPLSDVWNTLLNFASYPDWNPFVRSQVVCDALFIPIADQTPEENLRLIIQAQIPPLPLPVNASTPSNLLNAQISFENITHLDTTNNRAAWREIFTPPSLLSAERWQVLSTVETVDGSRTYYESYEAYVGPLGYVVDSLLAEGLQESFDTMAVALKIRMEGN